MKSDVKPAATDDRLCGDCYEDNRQLAEQQGHDAADASACAEMRPVRVTNKKSVNKSATLSCTSDSTEAVSIVTGVDSRHQAITDTGYTTSNHPKITVVLEAFNKLRQQVLTQQSLIRKVQSQFQFVPSFLDIKKIATCPMQKID